MRLKPTCSRGLPIEESSMLLRPDDASVPERVYDGVVHNRVWLAALALHCLERLHCESTTQCTQSSTCLFLMQVISAGLDVETDLRPHTSHDKPQLLFDTGRKAEVWSSFVQKVVFQALMGYRPDCVVLQPALQGCDAIYAHATTEYRSIMLQKLRRNTCRASCHLPPRSNAEMSAV